MTHQKRIEQLQRGEECHISNHNLRTWNFKEKVITRGKCALMLSRGLCGTCTSILSRSQACSGHARPKASRGGKGGDSWRRGFHNKTSKVRLHEPQSKRNVTMKHPLRRWRPLYQPSTRPAKTQPVMVRLEFSQARDHKESKEPLTRNFESSWTLLSAHVRSDGWMRRLDPQRSTHMFPYNRML